MEKSNKFVWSKDDYVEPEDNMMCVNCKFRDKTLKSGYRKCICQKYTTLKNSKPFKIMYDNADCDYYEPEKE